MSTATTPQCLHCSANVTTEEILDGWCENCGKKIPSSMREGLRPSQPLVAPPVTSEFMELKPRHILLAVVVFVVAASGAFLIMQLV